MSEDIVVRLPQPGTIEDPLTEILRDGARRLLQQAIQAEVETLLVEHAGLVTEVGRKRDNGGTIRKASPRTHMGPARTSVTADR